LQLINISKNVSTLSEHHQAY